MLGAVIPWRWLSGGTIVGFPRWQVLSDCCNQSEALEMALATQQVAKRSRLPVTAQSLWQLFLSCRLPRRPQSSPCRPRGCSLVMRRG